ncbi:MAG: hypothetical protein WCT20_05425, partial [Candidatus Babeliales bacterium]
MIGRKYVMMLCAIVVVSQAAFGRNRSCAIIDSTAREQELYKPLTEILSVAGYKATYMGIDRVMDTSDKRLHLARYDTAFFLLGSEFFCGLPHSHVSRKILNLLAQYSALRGKTIGLFLPSLRAHPGMNVVSCFVQAFGAMGLQTPMGAIADPFFKAVNTFLAMPLEMRQLGYHTTLNPPHFPFTSIETILSHYYAERSGHDPVFLPINHNCCPEVQATLPYGVYWYNQARKNHIFVSTITLATFSGITESFHVCPIRFDLRYQMHEMLLQVMCELRQFSLGDGHGSRRHPLPFVVRNEPCESLESMNGGDASSPRTDLFSNSGQVKRPELPKFLQKFGDPLDRDALDVGSDKRRKIAWMELDLFEDRDYAQTKLDKDAVARDIADRQERRARLVGYVMASGVDTLWMSLSPNTYYSSIARHKEQKNKTVWRKEQQFLAGIKRFTSMLND